MTLHDPRPSLIRRIIVRLTVIGLASGGIAYAFLFYEFSVLLHGLKDSTLYGEAEYIADHIQRQDDGHLQLILPADTAALYQSGSRRYRVTSQGRLLGQSDPAPASSEDLNLSHPGDTTVGFDDLVGVYERPVEQANHYLYGAIVAEEIDDFPVEIQVERETEHFSLLADTLLDEFFNDGGWLGIPFLLLTALASILTVVQTLRPLRSLSQQARTIGPGTSSERLNEAAAPHEVLPLVQAVNGAVDRLDQAFEAQRAFTADAAHELRTPLAILKMRLDGLPPGEIRQDLERDVAVMERLVSQLLKGARLETVALTASDRADLCQVAQEVAEACALLAVRRHINLELESPDGPLEICGQMGPLYDALRNLVENAMAKTPPGKRVLITVTPYALTVADQGPGIPAHERPYLFQRFWQGRDKTSGAGLGLSIVQRVADLHQATLAVQDTPGGGATFVLSFSPPPPTGSPDPADSGYESRPWR